MFAVQVSAADKFAELTSFSVADHCGSQMSEHQAVRNSAEAIGASHMTIIDLHDEDATNWLRRLLANDVGKITDSKVHYTCMCRQSDGVIDDLIVYCLASDRYRLVISPVTRDKDMEWLETHYPSCYTDHELDETAMLAVQRVCLAVVTCRLASFLTVAVSCRKGKVLNLSAVQLVQ